MKAKATNLLTRMFGILKKNRKQEKSIKELKEKSIKELNQMTLGEVIDLRKDYEKRPQRNIPTLF